MSHGGRSRQRARKTLLDRHPTHLLVERVGCPAHNLDRGGLGRLRDEPRCVERLHGAGGLNDNDVHVISDPNVHVRGRLGLWMGLGLWMRWPLRGRGGPGCRPSC